MEVTVTGAELDEKEIQEYKAYLLKKFPHHTIESLHISVLGDEAELTYTLRGISFERIRRITGYLVGNLDRFNDAKRAEVEDRVKHGLN